MMTTEEGLDEAVETVVEVEVEGEMEGDGDGDSPEFLEDELDGLIAGDTEEAVEQLDPETQPQASGDGDLGSIIVVTGQAENGDHDDKQLRDYFARVSAARMEVINSRGRIEVIKSELKEAKAIHDAAVADLMDATAQISSWSKPLPLFDATAAVQPTTPIDDKPSSPIVEPSEEPTEDDGGDGDDATPSLADRGQTKLDTLGFSPGLMESLTQGGFDTVADIGQFTAKGGKLHDVAGIGKGKAAKIAERLERFWMED